MQNLELHIHVENDMTWTCSTTRHVGEGKCVIMCLSEYRIEKDHLADVGLHRIIILKINSANIFSEGADWIKWVLSNIGLP